jgi:hypothetical protein
LQGREKEKTPVRNVWEFDNREMGTGDWMNNGKEEENLENKTRDRKTERIEAASGKTPSPCTHRATRTVSRNDKKNKRKENKIKENAGVDGGGGAGCWRGWGGRGRTRR